MQSLVPRATRMRAMRLIRGKGRLLRVASSAAAAKAQGEE
jgi:hypothetical protein